MSTTPPRIRDLPTQWQDVILVCRKCSKRARGGFGPDRDARLDKALRKLLGVRKGRKGSVGFVGAPCFDICPKNAVVVVRGSAPGAIHLVPHGMPVAEVAAALGLAPAAERDPPVSAASDEDARR